MNPPKAERAKPSLSSDYNLLFKNKIGESSLDIHRYSVLEVVKAFEKASGRKVPYKIGPRRAGDIAANWCDPAQAKELFGWEAMLGIDDMCRDAWRFEEKRAEELKAK